jgi:hypothetical protein
MVILTGMSTSRLAEVLVSVLFFLVLLACTIVPWILHWAVGWWAGLLSIPLLFGLYDYLFVPKGSLCTGLTFGVPLGSAMALLLLDGGALFVWILRGVVGGWPP